MNLQHVLPYHTQHFHFKTVASGKLGSECFTVNNPVKATVMPSYGQPALLTYFREGLQNALETKNSSVPLYGRRNGVSLFNRDIERRGTLRIATF